MEYPKRKRARLKDFDYSENGAYFITVCTKDKRKLLSQIIVKQKLPKNSLSNDDYKTVKQELTPAMPSLSVSRHTTVGQGLAPAEVILSKYGKIAEEQLQQLETRFPSVKIDHYVIMPNHIHTILFIQSATAGASPCPTTDTAPVANTICPTISDVICAYKSLTTRLCNKQGHIGSLFQTSFHDHIIRNRHDYEEIWKYIENNPAKWEEDTLYTP